jgi:hypothetical protein
VASIPIRSISEQPGGKVKVIVFDPSYHDSMTKSTSITRTTLPGIERAVEFLITRGQGTGRWRHRGSDPGPERCGRVYSWLRFVLIGLSVVGRGNFLGRLVTSCSRWMEMVGRWWQLSAELVASIPTLSAKRWRSLFPHFRLLQVLPSVLFSRTLRRLGISTSCMLNAPDFLTRPPPSLPTFPVPA